jgi:hypothetical protein
MNFGEVLTIEDLGNHAAAAVIGLGILLAGPVNVTPDLKRKGFYERLRSVAGPRNHCVKLELETEQRLRWIPGN